MTVKEFVERFSRCNPQDKVMIEIDKVFNNAVIEVYNDKTDESIPVAFFDLLRNNLSDDLYV